MGVHHDKPSGAFDDLLNELISRLDHLDQSELLAIRAAWQAIPFEAHEAAWASVREVAATRHLEADVEMVRDRAMHWALRGDNRPPLYHVAADDDTINQIRAGAAAAVVDVALALALGRWLEPNAYDTLARPWELAVGRLDEVLPRR